MDKNRQKLEDICKLLEIFIRGDNRSLEFAGQIGVVLDDFSADELLNDYRVSLAMYCPGGGEFLYDEEQMTSQLKTLKYELELRLKN